MQVETGGTQSVQSGLAGQSGWSQNTGGLVGSQFENEGDEDPKRPKTLNDEDMNDEDMRF